MNLNLMNLKRCVIAVCILAVSGGAGWFLLARGPLAPAKVTVAKAQLKNLEPSVFGIGTVEAKDSYAIGPTQAGRVLTVLADEGDKVRAGQILGEMDPVDLPQQLQSATAEVAEAQDDLALSEAQVKSASSQYELAQAEADRDEKLLAAGAIAQQAADTQQTAASTAKANLDAALASQAAAQEKVAQAEADRSAVVSQLANLKLISPVNGIVVSLNADPGTTVVAGQAVFDVVDPKTLWVHTRIDQSQFDGIAVGEPASIVLRSKPDQPIGGKVARLEIQGDDVTEERFVDVSFDTIPSTFSLGDLAEVTIELPSVADALAVPSAAVERVNGQDGVWMVQNGQVQFRPVTLGVRTLNGETQIVSGLAPGDVVVVYSSKQLRAGMKVKEEGHL